MLVPFSSVVFLSFLSCLSTSPRAKSMQRVAPSRKASIRNSVDNALTAFMPTPLRPTDFLKASESYFAPVLILEAQSISFPRGMPLPKSRTVMLPSGVKVISICLPNPIANSSIQLSMTSFTRMYMPSSSDEPSPNLPMYIPGRSLMCSFQSKDFMLLSV